MEEIESKLITICKKYEPWKGLDFCGTNRLFFQLCEGMDETQLMSSYTLLTNDFTILMDFANDFNILEKNLCPSFSINGITTESLEKIRESISKFPRIRITLDDYDLLNIYGDCFSINDIASNDIKELIIFLEHLRLIKVGFIERWDDVRRRGYRKYW